MFLKVGLIGAPRSGKSIIGNYLVNCKNFVQFAFADRIKKEFFANYQYTEKDFEEAKKYSIKTEQQIREELWNYSDVMRKKFGNKYFITPVVDDIQKYEGNVIVTDIRTNEEFSALKKIGMKFVVIVRDEFPTSESGIKGTRISYKDISKIKVFWNRFDDFESLYKECDMLLEELIW